MPSEYEKFQEQMFEEMDELERASQLREQDVRRILPQKEKGR